MTAFWVTSALAALFVGTHLGLSLGPVRGRLVGRLGETRFLTLYGVVAWVTLGALVAWYVAHGTEGPPGLGLGAFPAVRPIGIAAIAVGVVFMATVVAPSGYVASAHLVFAEATPPPRGMERITRHPFFVGLTLFALGHAALAVHLQGTVVFALFAVLALAGSVHMDRKLLARRGATYEAYLQQTSLVPFAAILAGRQRLALGELPWLFLVAGAALAWGTRELHGVGFAWSGHLVMAALVLGPAVFAVVGLRKRRARRRETAASG